MYHPGNDNIEVLSLLHGELTAVQIAQLLDGRECDIKLLCLNKAAVIANYRDMFFRNKMTGC